MKLNDLRRTFRYLDITRKIIFFAAFSGIIFAFFPWFEYTMRETELINGFSRFGIFGILSVVIALLIIFVLIREVFFDKRSCLNINNSFVWMILAGEAVYSLVIAVFVFSALFKEFSTSEFRFGIFLSIIAYSIIFVCAYLIYVDDKKVNTKKEFQRLSEDDIAKLNLQPEVPKEQLTLGD